MQEHKNDEQENISRREEYIRLEGLRSVYAAAEPLRSETEKALILGKKLRTEYDNAGKKAADLKAAADKKSKEAQEKEKFADSVLRLYKPLKMQKNPVPKPTGSTRKRQSFRSGRAPLRAG